MQINLLIVILVCVVLVLAFFLFKSEKVLSKEKIKYKRLKSKTRNIDK